MGKTKVRDIAILRCIGKYNDAYGYAPTIRELGTLAGLSSVSTVFNRLAKLEQSGFIIRKDGTARTIRLTETGRQLVGEVRT